MKVVSIYLSICAVLFNVATGKSVCEATGKSVCAATGKSVCEATGKSVCDHTNSSGGGGGGAEVAKVTQIWDYLSDPLLCIGGGGWGEWGGGGRRKGWQK